MKSLLISLLLLQGWVAHAQHVKYNDEYHTPSSYSEYSKAGVTFLRNKNYSTPEQFSASPYNAKPDPAFLQNKYPLTEEMRKAVTPNDIKSMTQEEIDQLYIRLTSGPIVPAQYSGSIAMNGEARLSLRRALRSVKAIDTLYKAYAASGAKLLCKDPVACFGEMLWSGKEIFQKNMTTGVRELRNAINPILADIAIKAFGGNISDLNSNEKIFLRPKKIDAISAQTYKKTMLFPAKVYCGQSLFDHRRESTIIDYAWTSDWGYNSGIGANPNMKYIAQLDSLGGVGKLAIRDEIRMIRPGLYLGRAYMNKIFILNFVLENPNLSNWQGGTLPEDSCFNGTKTR